MKIHEFLTEETRCKGAYARDSKGHSIEPRHPNAVCWCLVGALNVCYPTWEEREDANCKLANVLGNRNFVLFNDSSTWTELHDIVVKADV